MSAATQTLLPETHDWLTDTSWFTDRGSTMSIVFTPDFSRVLIGWSFKAEMFKHPCGKIEPKDFSLGPNTPEETYVRVCGLRELGRETFPEVVDNLLLYQPLRYQRPIKKTGPDGKPFVVTQYHHVGILKEEIPLYGRNTEHEEMDVPEYWSPYEVLRLDRVIDNPELDNKTNKKVNPFHQLAFAHCLLQLRQELKDTIPDFSRMWANLARVPMGNGKAVDVYDYVGDLRAMISKRII